MKTTKKLVLIAGIILQSTGSLYAGPWEDAVLLFGGGRDLLLAAQGILNGAKSVVATAAAQQAKKSGTDQAMAIASYMSAPSVNKTGFFKKNKLSDNDVLAALQAIVADAQSRAVVQQPVVQQPAAQKPVPATGWGWFNGSSASTAPAITPANVQAAVRDQQQADLALAAANNDALARIVSSGKSGIGLYTAFIDYIFSVLQQAVNSIADARTQQQVLSYMQGKFANMKASVAANNYRSNTLGRMNSKTVKKSSKKNKHKNL